MEEIRDVGRVGSLLTARSHRDRLRPAAAAARERVVRGIQPCCGRLGSPTTCSAPRTPSRRTTRNWQSSCGCTAPGRTGDAVAHYEAHQD